MDRRVATVAFALMTVTRLTSIRAPIIALVVFETFALVVRVVLQFELQNRGIEEQLTKDLSYLVVPLILGVCCWPILTRHTAFLKQVLDPRILTWKLVLVACAIGLLVRLTWWSQLVSSISIGLVRDPDPNAIAGPVFGFQCPPAPNLALYLVVMALLVPLVEEVINRGFILAGLLRYGRVLAVLGSSLLFAVHHAPEAMFNAFLYGSLLSLLVLRTGSLWPSAITHGSYNGLIALDWLCLRSVWNPAGMTSGLRNLGIGTAMLTVLLVVVTIWLAWRRAPALLRCPAPAERG